jgi:hypothetical protein
MKVNRRGAGRMPSKSAEVVELTVPCDAKYLVVVRLATAGVGNRAGLSVEDIEDIKVARTRARASTRNSSSGESRCRWRETAGWASG